MKENEIPEVMDIRQAAIYLGVSRDAMYQYANGGMVPCFKIGNRWRFRKDALIEWMKGKESEESRK